RSDLLDAGYRAAVVHGRGNRREELLHRLFRPVVVDAERAIAARDELAADEVLEVVVVIGVGVDREDARFRTRLERFDEQGVRVVRKPDVGAPGRRLLRLLRTRLLLTQLPDRGLRGNGRDGRGDDGDGADAHRSPRVAGVSAVIKSFRSCFVSTARTASMARVAPACPSVRPARARNLCFTGSAVAGG